uniref:Uncharacterized protein n=1 Tax=Ciona intestinalis TaxID=7719 RepID=H2XP65_CIOIN
RNTKTGSKKENICQFRSKNISLVSKIRKNVCKFESKNNFVVAKHNNWIILV